MSCELVLNSPFLHVLGVSGSRTYIAKAAVVRVRSADDVSAALAQIRKHSIPFTVRGESVSVQDTYQRNSDFA
jgi:FAD/FMN-containing dehydrogenase